MHPGVQGADEHAEGLEVLLAAEVALFLVLPQRAVVEDLDAGEQHVDEVVLEAVELVREEGDGVEVPLRRPPAGELEDVAPEDGLRVVVDALRAEREGPEHRPELVVQTLEERQVRHPGLHLGRLRRLGELLRQGEPVGRRLAGDRSRIRGFLDQELVTPGVSVRSQASTSAQFRRLIAQDERGERQ